MHKWDYRRGRYVSDIGFDAFVNKAEFWRKYK